MDTIKIYKNHKLKSYNTFAIDAKARHFIKIENLKELKLALTSPEVDTKNIFILGGGSNVLLTQDIQTLVIHNAISGLDVIKENDEYILLKVGAGMNWHQLVLYCVEKNYAGIENLSLIPGTVGAAPIQNIGAYGVELKNVFISLEAYNIKAKTIEVLSLSECEFNYRNSIFKHKAKNKYIVLNVTLKLNKKPTYNISYDAIKNILDKLDIKVLSTKIISDAVIKIRQEKLPDPNVIPNAGSFFKNPYIDKQLFYNIQQKHPDIPHFSIDANTIKVPAGWLIEQCHWKGKRVGKVGVHPKQALVLANYDGATGIEVKQLAEKIQCDVFTKFNIKLTPEVTII